MEQNKTPNFKLQLGCQLKAEVRRQEKDRKIEDRKIKAET
jgi:hypothetical protein